MTRSSRFRLRWLVLTLLLGATACGGDPLDDLARLEVSMVDVAFEPSRIEVDAGEPVVLTVTNRGALEHDLDLPAAGLHVHGYPGVRETTLLKIDQPGTYEALCLTPGHAEAGMKMEVVVR